ncbi:hypothetical protein PIIN_07303 [Serendipita indica DSM 11827]|uniref:Uncharacterized protein n=1 Tax=Serendipita indica (strain DSM 11827) TaxID=1109443 RepID=G4TPV5_SERID|nr:hypothetical protein PIIN_07303 [Serendipita indica DSM 11827]
MTIRLWDTGSSQPLGKPFRGHEHYVATVAFSSDGSAIVSGSSDRTINYGMHRPIHTQIPPEMMVGCPQIRA